ncbi:aminotransferase class III-fold pyridoxal phosphate-dependent enzyme [Aliikangiella sp. G2MR2-5]|uniref:aminotransferase class III-fold pyridoxal phosphate-dependent enzyme n=1 Tax=Aliikangiella sp. G2MR2-5 TaxID=2788943 RepID=UPI0018AA6FB3|nr:aminotransferase class III-fold pyridoxal phosphate-dependent enzyme [Aliikangiella sp. G2MR2-5]
MTQTTKIDSLNQDQSPNNSNPLSNSPALSIQDIRALIAEHFNLEGELSELPSYCDLNRLLITDSGDKFVIKIANPLQDKSSLDFENQAMTLLSQKLKEISVPELLVSKKTGAALVAVQDQLGRNCFMRVISFLEGDLWAKQTIDSPQYFSSLGKALANTDKVLKSFKHPQSHRFLIWDLRNASSVIRSHVEAIKGEDNNKTIQQILNEFETLVVPLMAELPEQIIHNDANDYNLLVNPEQKMVSGLFDFGDMVHTFRIAELAIAAAYALMSQDEIEQPLTNLVVSYHQNNPLTAQEIEVLLSFIKARLAVSLCMSSYEYQQNPENDYLLVSQNGAWETLKKLNTIDPVSLKLKLKFQCGLSENADNQEEIIRYRKTHLSENLSLAYKQPLKIVEGKGAYLYREDGSRYLDMVNNVCHVGHCHPDVVLAGQKQMAKLNTNTRYLHDNIVTFSKKLLATMPEELSVCMFVNSGSEANELALRLARQYTQRKSMVVVEGAYHGNTNGCIEISPYKFDGPGGNGSPEWVKQTIVPDPFRGKYRGRNEEVGYQYALDVKRAVKEFEESGHPVCAFICESIQGVGGQVIHPPGYLKNAYQFVREAGGICIADEVQVGMGRVGSHWWAFQTQDAIPDIVTIGKPLGNGHPLAAVVTTKEIADAFVTGMEYFNTFGGNPVSCAIGSAVLDVVEKENLMEHALSMGNALVDGLIALQKKFPVIGDVRGLGMFVGAEFVKDLDTLEPAIEQIDYVIERLKSEGILLTTEGPFHNVFKIKPPLAFSKEDLEFFLGKLELILAEDGARV